MFQQVYQAPDGRVFMLNHLGIWVELRPMAVQPAVPAAIPQQQLFQGRVASQPPASSQASSISEEIAEEVLAQPELAELPTKARASCPVVEEEVEPKISSPPMTFLSSQDRTPPLEQAESESGTSSSSRSETVDLSEDFPLFKQVVKPTTSTTIECQKWHVLRRVQVRDGPTAASNNVCVLNPGPGKWVKVVKTKTAKTKAGFITTKAYILSDEGQGWVSVNRQHKKTTETFVFKGQASAALKKLLQSASVWKHHEAEVGEICNATAKTFTVRVTCPTWEQTEALRAELGKSRVCGRVLLNKKTPQLVNLRRSFGNCVPTVHVFDIDTDIENNHAKFWRAFDWSTKEFQHQVGDDLRNLQFRGLRNISWAAGRTSRGYFTVRDYCTLEFSKDAQLRHFLKNFEKYDFFQGASVREDPIYANFETVSADLLKA